MSKQTITLGLSVHRPETIPFMEALMREHEAVFLEEPTDPGFEPMLEGALSVDDYLMGLDVEYPAFTRKMCELLRDLKREGKQVFQVEPYMEALYRIHEFFADGHRPEDLDKNAIQYPVYLAERNATGALLDYYRTVMTGSFDKTLEAVLRFARLDAARFRLRDTLRVQALEPMLKTCRSAFIEAGMMHYPLWMGLRRLSRPGGPRLVFVTEAALKTIGMKGRLYGPGDRLTLLYVFHPNTRQPVREALLAARSLVYAKLIVKEESADDTEGLPHLEDELSCIHIVNRLTLDDCRRLFPMVRRSGTLQAHGIVSDYLAGAKPSPDPVGKAP